MADQIITPRNFAIEPDLTSAIETKMRELSLNLNCHAIGTIQQIDWTQNSVQVSINYKKSILQFNQATQNREIVYIDYPILAECPIVTLYGGAARLTFPTAAGDTCLLFFNDRNMDTWITSGQVAPVPSTRLHAFNDAIAMVGIKNFQAPFTISQTNVELINGTTMISLGAEKIKIANASKSLLTILNNLISAFTSNPNIVLVTGSPGDPSPINPAILTALDTASTDLGALLE
jgi:hypothetical protein